MIVDFKQQDVDLWEAWIDVQSTDTENRFTLYVVGDVFTDDKLSYPYFKKKETDDLKVLALEILPGITSEDGYVTEILYAEELDAMNQYESIAIYAGSEIIKTISDIERFG
jgi:hypothetical protein